MGGREVGQGELVDFEHAGIIEREHEHGLGIGDRRGGEHLGHAPLGERGQTGLPIDGIRRGSLAQGDLHRGVGGAAGGDAQADLVGRIDDDRGQTKLHRAGADGGGVDPEGLCAGVGIGTGRPIAHRDIGPSGVLFPTLGDEARDRRHARLGRGERFELALEIVVDERGGAEARQLALGGLRTEVPHLETSDLEGLRRLAEHEGEA